MMDFKDRKVLVTGSSSGIGAELARKFAEFGAYVAVHGRNKERSVEIRDEIIANGGNACCVIGDLNTVAGANAVVDEAAGLLGGIDILINNAGCMVNRAGLGDFPDSLLDDVLETNIKSLIYVSRRALPYLEAEGTGVVVNTSSAAASHGGAGGSGFYASAKGFVETYTKNMAKELACKGIRVNAVAPGLIDTPFHVRHNTPEKLENARKSIPLGKIGTPDDCWGAYLFLASNVLSGYITGQVVGINGGRFV